MKKTTLNFIIDAVGFVGFLLLTSTGLLVRYVLPPGSGHHSTLWGMDRHEWGGVHFWVAVCVLGVMVFHLFLHWRWIVNVMRGRPREGSGMRLAIGLAATAILALVAFAPFGSSVKRIDPDIPETHGAAPGNHETELVRGRTTLAEIEESLGVPAAYLIERFHLPADVARDAGVARLGKENGFALDEIRAAVQEYRSGAR